MDFRTLMLSFAFISPFGFSPAQAVDLVNDVITRADIADPTNPYSDPYTLSATSSGAVYQLKGRVQSSGGSTYMVWDDESGLCVTTPAEGAVRSVSVAFEPGQSRLDERLIYIYTSSDIYSGVADAYSPMLRGELAATRTAEADFEYTFADPVRSFALAQGDLPIRIASISVTWDRDAAAPMQKCGTPTVSPADGSTVVGSMMLTIEAAHPSHAIYFTTDGSTPSPSHGRLYTEPLFIEDLEGYGPTTVVKAIASASGMSDSDVAVARYTAFAETEAGVFGLVTDTEQLADGDKIILVGTMLADTTEGSRRGYALTSAGYPRPFGERLPASSGGAETAAQYNVVSSAVDILTLHASGSPEAPWVLESSDGSVLWTDGATQSLHRGDAPAARSCAAITINSSTSHAEIIFPADPSQDNAIRFEPGSRRFLASGYQGGYVVRPFIYKYGLSGKIVVSTDIQDNESAIYTLQGVRLDGSEPIRPGFYIIRDTKGGVSKIAVR